MKILPVFILLGVVALAATVAAPTLLEGAWRPDLFAILLVYVALRAPKRAALAWAWAVGLARDVSAGGSFGVHASLALVAAFVIVHFRTEIENRPLVSYVPWVAVVAAIAGAADWTLLIATGYAPALAAAGRGIALSAMATMLVSFPAMWLLNRLNAWLGIRRRYRFGSG